MPSSLKTDTSANLGSPLKIFPQMFYVDIMLIIFQRWPSKLDVVHYMKRPSHHQGHSSRSRQSHICPWLLQHGVLFQTRHQSWGTQTAETAVDLTFVVASSRCCFEGLAAVCLFWSIHLRAVRFLPIEPTTPGGMAWPMPSVWAIFFGLALANGVWTIHRPHGTQMYTATKRHIVPSCPIQRLSHLLVINWHLCLKNHDTNILYSYPRVISWDLQQICITLSHDIRQEALIRVYAELLEEMDAGQLPELRALDSGSRRHGQQTL